MNWVEIVLTVSEKDADKVMLAPLSNIAGADIMFDKGYGTIKINVPADVADNLTNGSGKYVGGLLLIDRRSYEEAKGGIEPRKPQTNADRIRAMSDEELARWVVEKTVYQESAFSPPSYLNFLTGLDDTKESAIKGTVDWLRQPACGGE